MKNMEANQKKETELRDYLIEQIEANFPNSKLNGNRTKRLPNNVNFSFPFIEGESMLIMLDMKESVHPAVPPVHQDLSILPMYCLRSDCSMKWHMVHSALR